MENDDENPTWVDREWRRFPGSSNVRAARLMPTEDPARCHVQVEYGSGAAYEYRDVPRDIMPGLLAAESAGRWIRNQLATVYPFDRVPNEGPVPDDADDDSPPEDDDQPGNLRPDGDEEYEDG